MIIDNNVMKNVFQVFLLPMKRTIFEALDKEHFSELTLDIVNMEELTDSLEVVSEGRPLYYNEYYKNEETYNFLACFSDMFIKKISDIHMGGTGDVDPEDELTELDVNATVGIMQEMEHNFSLVYNEICSIPLKFDENGYIIRKEDEKYKEILDQCRGLDYMISLKLCIRSEECMVAKWFISQNAINEMLSNIDLENDLFKNVIDETSRISLNTINDVDLDLTAELGKCQLPVKTALELDKGSFVTLDDKVGDNIRIYVNGVVVGEGEVVVVGENFGIRVKKLYTKDVPEATK